MRRTTATALLALVLCLLLVTTGRPQNPTFFGQNAQLAPPPTCSDFSDDFSAGTLNARWNGPPTALLVGPVPNALMTAGPSGGELVITVPANPTDVEYSGISTSATHDLTGGSVSVRVPQIMGPSAIHVTAFAAGLDSASYLRIVEYNGTLYATKVVGGSETVVASTLYNASSHLYWRFRESGGTTYWETSANRLTWTEIGGSAHQSNPLPDYPNFIYSPYAGAIGAGTAAATEAHFDDVCAE